MMGGMPTTRQSDMPQPGPIGRQVVANLRELLEARGLSFNRASEAMGKLGRHLPPLGFSRILQGKRRVDVDEVLALSVVLGVSPLALLLPRHTAAGEVIEVTPEVQQRASIVWDWAAGKWPLPAEAPWPEGVALSFPVTAVADFDAHSRPDFSPREPEPTPAQKTLDALIWEIGEIRKDPSRWPVFRDRMLRNFRVVAIQLEEVFAAFDAAALADGSFTFDAEAAQREIQTAAGWVRGPADAQRFREAADKALWADVDPNPHGAATSDPHRGRGAATTVPGPHGPINANVIDPVPGPHGASTSRVVDPFGERDQ